jgi:glutamate:GABA antiporter
MTGETAGATGLRRTIGFRDLVLFYVVALVGMRWVSIAAAAGPSALTGWVIGVVAFFVPLAFTVLELSSRYPQEGGIYVWTKQAFGEFGGFVTGWTYWGSNLTYLPGMLYFAASSGLFIFGSRFAGLQNDGLYFIVVSLVGLALAAWLNIIGLQVGKWLNNMGGISTWVVLALLIVLGLLVAWRFGTATPITLRSLIPTFDLKDLIFWSVLAFALAGLESGSFMGDEIESPRRNIPRAICVSGALIAGFYILGTLAMLVALPRGKISGLSGFMDAVASITARLGLGGIDPLVAVLIVVNMLGGVSLWLAATARLPFVAGIDNYLPRAFGKLHPRYGTPHVALWLQTIATAVCVVIGQAGATPKAAYEMLVSLGVISYFLPYLVMFAALIKLQREPAAPGVIRVPGGKSMAIVAGATGFATTLVSCVFAAIPPANEPHPARYVIKVAGLSLLLVASGMVTYVLRKQSVVKQADVAS